MPNTDPINIPIKATDGASKTLKGVAAEAGKVEKKGVTVDVKGPGGGPIGGLLSKVKGVFAGMAGPIAAAGAVAAGVGKFVGDAVSSFQDLALEVGKFADATGLSTEEASKFVEVAGDLGVSADQAQSLIGKFNKVVGATPELLAEYGIEVQKAADGTTDVAGTFLNAVEAVQQIKDPTDRAKAAAELFGRSWQGAAELVMTNVGELKASFASVSDEQIIDADELDKAKRARDNFDHLSDSLKRLQVRVGESLVPVLADAADQLGDIIDKAGKAADAISSVGHWDAPGWWDSWSGAVQSAIDGLAATPDAIKKHKDATADARDVVTDFDAELSALARQTLPEYQSASGDATDATDAQADAEDRAADAAKRYSDGLDSIRKRLDFKKESKELVAQVGGAMLTVGAGAQVASDDVYKIEKSILDVAEMAGATEIEVQTAIDAVERGDWNAVAGMVQGWANQTPVNLPVKLHVNEAEYQRLKRNFEISGTPYGAAAAAAVPASAGVAALAAPMPVMPVTVNVHAGMVADSVTLARAMTRGERQATRLLGSRWREVAA